MRSLIIHPKSNHTRPPVRKRGIMRALLLSAFSVGLLTACSDDEDEPMTGPTPVPTPKTIAEIAAADTSFSTLVAALSAAKLVETLKGAGPFTVFAPKNAAFAALPAGTVEALLANPEGDLKKILLYHVVSGSVKADAVVKLTKAATMNGKDVTIEVKDGSVILNGKVKVIATDIMASNGVIHVIDGVLLPPADVVPEPTPKTIAEIAAADTSFSTLVAALSAAKLVETLKGAGPFTVFAPKNAAFAALPAGTVEALLANPEGDLKKILLYHVVSGSVKAEAVVKLTKAATVNGKDVTIEVKDGSVILNGKVKVIATDIMASNGVIHVIDGVLLPPADVVPEPTPKTIAEIAAADTSFSTLVAALSAAKLVETLKGAGPFTVFAPKNAAFAALPAGTVEALLANPEGDLKKILLYHVVSGSVKADAVVKLTKAATVNGKDVTIEVKDGSVILNGKVKVIATDIMASNGVIHVIDGVLLPPADVVPEPTPKTIAEIAAADTSFSTLVAALSAAKLVETLKGAGPFTVFAPKNAAFAALPAGTVEALLANPEGDLKKILLYHVVSGSVKAEAVVKLTKAATVNGKDVTIEVIDGSVILNGKVKVIATDIMASNGVIHVIDGVLLPPAE
jgi:transforming growth factor-beta-induced protein